RTIAATHSSTTAVSISPPSTGERQRARSAGASVAGPVAIAALAFALLALATSAEGQDARGDLVRLVGAAPQAHDHDDEQDGRDDAEALQRRRVPDALDGLGEELEPHEGEDDRQAGLEVVKAVGDAGQ